jgi:mono/diheme cytochrome c family protein
MMWLPIWRWTLWLSLICWLAACSSSGADGNRANADADAGREAAGDAGEAGAPERSDAGAWDEPGADPQRSGDPERGRALLLNNGTEDAPYLSCGVPKALVDLVSAGGLDVFGSGPRLAERERGNAELPYDYSYAITKRGVQVVTTNCLLCHASQIGDSLIVGLGNANVDFASEGSLFGLPPDTLESAGAALDEDERLELARFTRVLVAAAEQTTTDTIGQNPADVMFTVLAAHRDPDTLEWHDDPDPEANLDPAARVWSDVPAWWGMYRRDRMFYGGFGRGDHARIMMSAALMCLENADEAAAIDAYFPDIEAYILSLRAPAYEDVAHASIDAQLAEHGRGHYETLCAGCHGDAERGIPPVPLIELTEVDTDPRYAESLASGDGMSGYFFEFFNRSWYGTQGAAGRLSPVTPPSYAPPPLDGVWATAPYFHNGSVPTLDAVLDPSKRPAIFRRSFDPESYDFERCGWPYEEVAEKGDDPSVYDTTQLGGGNGGHDYAAELTDDERAELLEYLKTL